MAGASTQVLAGVTLGLVPALACGIHGHSTDHLVLTLGAGALIDSILSTTHSGDLVLLGVVPTGEDGIAGTEELGEMAGGAMALVAP